MAKDTREPKGKPEEKKPDATCETKSSCGCGCIPPIKTK